MGKKRFIDADYWTDSWVVDNLNPLDSHLFIYLFSNPQSTIAGVYKLSLRVMSSQIGLEREELLRMIKRLEPKVRYVDGWMILVNGIKHQNYKNSKIKTGIEIALQDVPPEILQYINWPKDFGNPKPTRSAQTQLIAEDIEQMFGSENVEKNSTVDKNAGEKKTTLTPEIRSMYESSHSSSSSSSYKTTVRKKGGNTTGKNYEEANFLFNDLLDLVNEDFREWYCKLFYRFGHVRVLVLASQARADGKDPKKLFSKLLKDEERKQGVK
jgi:hypothetical protein